jgi:tetratricopeptide (TPR) repeat protein
MFESVIGKKCKLLNYPPCDVIVDASHEACESCDGPLEIVKVTNKRLFISVCLAASIAILVIGFTALKIAFWLSKPAPARTIEATLAPADEAGLVKLLRSIYADGVKAPQEQARLQEAVRQLAVNSNWLTQKEEEIKGKADKTLASLKLGLAYTAREDYNQAQKEFRQSVEIDPENAFAWMNLAAADMKLGQLSQAKYACDKAITLDPHSWIAHYNLGSLYAINADKDNAIRELSEALRLVAEGQSPSITTATMAKQIKGDRSFDSLQKDRRFQELLARN